MNGNGRNNPLLIMGHGLGAQKDFKIPEFAEKFTSEGIAVFAFDYQTFGGSQGFERNIINVDEQLKDWESALNLFILKKIYRYTNIQFSYDVNRIALWGSSFSGGHVITLAGSYKHKDKIKGIITQIPFVDGFSSLKSLWREYGILPLIKCVLYSIKDIIRKTFRMPRQYIPLTSESKNEMRILPTEESHLGYASIIPSTPLGGWKNRVSASIFLEFPFYRPIKYAPNINTNVLIIASKFDKLCPIDIINEFGNILKKKEIHILDTNHFQPYTSSFDNVVDLEIKFLKKIFK